MPKVQQLALIAALALAGAAQAESVVKMHTVDAQGIGKDVGEVTLSETRYGLVLTPALTGLQPGLHGFHVHENANCAPAEKDGKPGAALAAGGHYDPQKTGRHGLPWGDAAKPELAISTRYGSERRHPQHRSIVRFQRQLRS